LDAGVKGEQLTAANSAPVRGKWTLTQQAFEGLLAALDDDRDSAGAKYVEIRSKLIRFFEWRACPYPEEHADETINRVARKVAEGEVLRNPGGYFLGVGRMVVLEIIKARAREQQVFGELAYAESSTAPEPESEAPIECLRECLQKLSPDNRELIVHYYEGGGGKKIENRKKLTVELGIPVNTLRMRALRLREKLQVCVEDCLQK
jgi:DNA-directed RNA polymerase specialized sigma24 family protein